MLRRSPFVAVRTDIRKEERILVVAELGGYNRHEALGRLVDMWCWCTDRKLEDAPADCDSYAVPEAVIRRFLGPRGVEALLGDGCDELALGERRPDGLICLRGTSETVRGLRRYVGTDAAAGGRARAAEASRAGGRFVSGTTTDEDPESQSSPSEASCLVVDSTIDQRASSVEPAVDQRASSLDPRSKILDPDPESEIPVKKLRACRLAPDWEPERSDANVRAEQQAKARGVDLRVELAKLLDWATGNGARRADWNAVWRNWTRNARAESRRQGQQQPTALERQLERVRRLELEELEQAERQAHT